jgi:hypothetical protein
MPAPEVQWDTPWADTPWWDIQSPATLVAVVSPDMGVVAMADAGMVRVRMGMGAATALRRLTRDRSTTAALATAMVTPPAMATVDAQATRFPLSADCWAATAPTEDDMRVDSRAAASRLGGGDRLPAVVHRTYHHEWRRSDLESGDAAAVHSRLNLGRAILLN